MSDSCGGREKEEFTPTNYCPLQDLKCKREKCAWWVDTRFGLGCAMFFIGARDALELKDE